jgi:hypothetical protein
LIEATDRNGIHCSHTLYVHLSLLKDDETGCVEDDAGDDGHYHHETTTTTNDDDDDDHYHHDKEVGWQAVVYVGEWATPVAPAPVALAPVASAPPRFIKPSRAAGACPHPAARC